MIGNEPSTMNQAIRASWSDGSPTGAPTRARHDVPRVPRSADHHARAILAMSRRK